MITPSDIENKEFRRVKKGFDPDEVDEFLDLIIVDMEKLIKENRRLKDELAKVSSQVDKHVNSESTVYETLAAAKQLMNDIAASAERRVEILLKNAELQADMITREAKENISRYTDEGNRLMSRVDLLRERYRSMLKDELDRVNEDNNDFFSEFRNDFMPASMQDLSDDDMKIRSREKNTETKTKVAEEKIDLTKTMVMKKGDL
ncbi:MAG: DivIVA domain-containing protein [Firmicutes bacterium]|nr:DivIVA domain-containing protein [Bacillota bacterium]